MPLAFSFVAPFFVFLLLMAIAVIFGVVKGNARKKALMAWAQQSGFSFAAGPRRGMGHQVGSFDCFQKGDDRDAENVMHSQRGDTGVLCFDWHYEETRRNSDGHTETSHYWSSNLLFTLDFAASELRIRKEGFFDKIGQTFGWNDIDFESAEFSREFHVSAKDRRWAFEVITTKVMEILLASPSFEVVLLDRHLLIRRTRRFAPEAYGQALVLGEAFLRAIPADVVAERRHRLGERGA